MISFLDVQNSIIVLKCVIGGIIALGLGVKNLNLTDLLMEFKKIAKETFKNNRAPKDKLSQTVAGWFQKFLLSLRVWESIYPSEPLKMQLQNTLHKDLTMFGAAVHTGRQRSIRVAVTAVKNGGKQPTVIANYNHSDRSASPWQFIVHPKAHENLTESQFLLPISSVLKMRQKS